jgi:hypothetical protein
LSFFISEPEDYLNEEINKFNAPPEPQVHFSATLIPKHFLFIA